MHPLTLDTFMNTIMKSLRSLVTASGLFFFVSCGSSPEPHPLPEAPARLTLDLSGEAYVLRAPLGTLEVRSPRTMDERVGVGGIVIVHGIPQGGSSGYYAYDMACPIEAPGLSVIVPYKDNEHEGLILYRCPSCGEVYELGLGIGNPVRGLGRHPLRQYTAILSGELLHISNRR